MEVELYFFLNASNQESFLRRTTPNRWRLSAKQRNKNTHSSQIESYCVCLFYSAAKRGRRVLFEMAFRWHPIRIPGVLGAIMNKPLLKHLPKQDNRWINLQLIQVISEQIRACGNCCTANNFRVCSYDWVFWPKFPRTLIGLWWVLNPWLTGMCCHQTNWINRVRFNLNKALLGDLGRVQRVSHGKYGYQVLSSL